MSWGRYLRLTVIVIVGGLLTLVEGLAQQRQLVAETPAAKGDHQLETVDQPKDGSALDGARDDDARLPRSRFRLGHYCPEQLPVR